MAGTIESRLSQLGISLPEAVTPIANYVPFTIAGDLVFLSGQLPLEAGTLRHKGALGQNVSIEDGYRAARICALNLVAQMKLAAGGDLDRIARIVRIGGFVAATPDFTDHPKVVNGASDFLVELFGDFGRHARTAVGVPSLPLGATVEVEAVVRLGPA